MQRNLADIISEISTAGATGILTLSMSNDTALFKIFFRNGKVYHITHGTSKDKACLAAIAEHPFVKGMFMAGAQVDMKDASLIPVETLMAAVRNANKMLEWSGRGDSGGKPSEHANVSTAVDGAVIARMEEELLNMVGPIAPMVLANAYGACCLKQGKPMMKPEFQLLLKTISEQLPEEHKKSFLKQFVWQGGN